MKPRILIWGFYEQGNIGDDLMAIIFAEMIKDIGATPVIFSTNPRFQKMGYETTNELTSNTITAILLGGGAFFKSTTETTPAIETHVIKLSEFITRTNLPIIGASLGSDGVSHLSQMTPARQSILASPSFRKAAIRLTADMNLGVNDLIYLPDVVFTTAYLKQRLRLTQPVSIKNGLHLINFSRRSLLQLPNILWRLRKQPKAFLLAHSGDSPTGGEITLPTIKKIHTDDIGYALKQISESSIVISSKLHPGVMALAVGSGFIAVSPRPKTIAFLTQSISEGIITQKTYLGIFTLFHLQPEIDWQKTLWGKYTNFLAESLKDAL